MLAFGFRTAPSAGDTAIPHPPLGADSYDPATKTAYRLTRAAFWRALRRIVRGAHPAIGMRLAFNPGGIAVWGDFHLYITVNGAPVLEAFDSETMEAICVRSWNGTRSGPNQWADTRDGVVALIEGQLRAQ